jgi:radical SAM superfamily enzyme YgiQ (UPF0313 family)
MPHPIQIHLDYLPGQPPHPGAFPDIRATRQHELQAALDSAQVQPGLTAEENAWLGRSFPVLAVLAPVMSTNEGKIEFPGDPMSLYAALSYAIQRVVTTRKMGWSAEAPYNDLCPQWGCLPAKEYRRNVDDNGIRSYDSLLLNTDQTVFDPRVWNEPVKEYFIRHVLEKVRPKVVLISAVSPAHRYAIEIARCVRATLPDCLVVLGGRHADETMHYDDLSQQLVLEPSSLLSLVQAGLVEPVVDFLIAGQGYHAIDLLMRAISFSVDIPTRAVRAGQVIQTLSDCAGLLGQPAGRSLLVGLGSQGPHAFPINGPRLELQDLPSPYSAFAIRARFSIFKRPDGIARTAHFMVTNSCPYHCYFCSESSAVVGEYLSFKRGSVDRVIERMVEYIDYGAQALFFDDSIFWGGDTGSILPFCREWAKIRARARQAGTPTLQLFGREIACEEILNLAWGAQMTTDLITPRSGADEGSMILRAMAHAGCTYLYIGIESMAEPVITQVHKNIHRDSPWDERVRTALGMAHSAGIRVGSSMLFGLDGETQATIQETIGKVEELLDEGLLFVASPNILTYHPNTAATLSHGMREKLDYHSPNLANCPPYIYFEEAFPAVVSRNLTDADIWHIHEQTRLRWGAKRNSNPMLPAKLPD